MYDSVASYLWFFNLRLNFKFFGLRINLISLLFSEESLNSVSILEKLTVKTVTRMQAYVTSNLVIKPYITTLSIILYESVASWQLFFSSQVNLTSILLAEVCFNRISILEKKQSKFSYFHKAATWSRYLEHPV